MKCALVASLLLSACSGSATQHAPADRYTVRAEIATMPSGAASTEIELHHEAIPSFKAQDGKVSTMSSMQMPFEVPTSVSLAGFSVKDKVAATFEVRWDEKNPLSLTKLEKLPAETALVLE